MQRPWITRFVSIIMLTCLTLLSLLGAYPAQAQSAPDTPVVEAELAPANAGLPSPVFDMNETAWISIRGYTSDEHQKFFDDVDKSKFMASDVEGYDMKGKHRYASVWQSNPDGRGWLLRRNLSLAEFEDLNKEQRKLGYRLIDQDAYIFNGTTYYAGIWIENVENLEWISYLNVSEADHMTFFNRYTEGGMIPIDIEVFTGAAKPLYSVIWVKNVEGLLWKLWRDMTSDEYAAKFDEYKAVYRVLDLESYQINGAQRYAAIWHQNKNGRGWAANRDMTAQGYVNRWNEMRDAGYRLIDFEAYPTQKGLRYAGVWRQNSTRPNWRLKDEVTALAQAYVDNNQVAGLSIAIARDGQFRYLRGFGFADIAANKTAHSQSIYRLASVSKAVAGVLTMRLVEDEVFALNDNTRDYFPGLPNFHTHTIGQAVSNRSGVRYYVGGSDPTESSNNPPAFATAQEAASLFSADPLLFTPGTGYQYTTQAYTLLGGAMEGALNKPIADIVNDHLTLPFGVPSLRAEDRSAFNTNRAALYASSAGGPVEVTADEISWKVLGGGLESSAYDLARLGMQLVDESMLSADSLTTMWTPPNNLSDFALGWNTGTDQGYQVVARTGAQTGSRSYIRFYPELDIVIIVLTNQWTTDNNSPTLNVQLGRDIGTLMLDNLQIAGIESASTLADDLAAATANVNSAGFQISAADSEFALDPRQEVGDIEAELDPVNRPAVTQTDPRVEPEDGASVPGSPVMQSIFLPFVRR
jgi:CubicO group peptidase (beta-lactamase class C family)